MLAYLLSDILIGLHNLIGLLSITEQLFNPRPILKAALLFIVIGHLAKLIPALLQALDI